MTRLIDRLETLAGEYPSRFWASVLTIVYAIGFFSGGIFFGLMG